MESIGRKLKDAREKLNCSLEQVARDTHISKNYLAALEEEDFSCLPGDPYVFGFLRNYAEYLSLNPDELVTLYKNMRLQEQPVPMAELLETRSKGSLFWRVGAAVVVVAGLAVGGFLLLRNSSQPVAEGQEPEAAGTESSVAGEKGRTFDFADEVLAQWFNQGDIIRVPVNRQFIDLEILELAERFQARIPTGTVEMNIGEERALDLDADNRPDVRLVLNDLDRGGQRANLGLRKIARPTELESEASAETEAPAAPAPAAPAQAPPAQTPAPTPPPAPAPAPVIRAGQAVTVLQAGEPSPFRVYANFRGYCLFRYDMDGETREERFFHKGEIFNLDVRKEVKLWISNAGSLRLMVAGRDVEIGKPGEVVTRYVRWRQDGAAGKYNLEIAPVD